MPMNGSWEGINSPRIKIIQIRNSISLDNAYLLLCLWFYVNKINRTAKNVYKEAHNV